MVGGSVGVGAADGRKVVTVGAEDGFTVVGASVRLSVGATDTTGVGCSLETVGLEVGNSVTARVGLSTGALVPFTWK